MTQLKRFNIRVYALVLDSNDQLLLSDEKMGSARFTKFPGGGLELGEGLCDGLKREIREELGAEVKSMDHFYTTDFFQESAFHKGDQLISVYYTVRLVDGFELVNKEVHEEMYEYEIFRWKPIHELEREDVTFPIDKTVVQMLKDQYI